MIVLDPDLDPYPARKIARTKRPVVPKRRASSRPDGVPSLRTLARFLSKAQTTARLRGRVSVLLTTDKAIRRLNREFRGIDKATDVLSFPPGSSTPNQEKLAGDVAISVPTAHRQSLACGHSLGIELKVLMLHGLLHLAGYDHETDSGQMARRERALRAKLGLPQGLIERVEGHGGRRIGSRLRAGSAKGQRLSLRPRRVS